MLSVVASGRQPPDALITSVTQQQALFWTIILLNPGGACVQTATLAFGTERQQRFPNRTGERCPPGSRQVRAGSRDSLCTGRRYPSESATAQAHPVRRRTPSQRHHS
ncbi:hypothetical protein SBA1_1040067 [Candidatus Sulfotelmatobacter kueseliae]|uniref:Uncharacterized protein n=1 Tax=Candidatus Sulfotelmatobacter kueseliae TaxID=2042962 RepID=A0A2U3JY83_9BACT|nr:hypothetical protein SBA1_1040067 [Candidatus Sulfotelmatobacter kueseliae]